METAYYMPVEDSDVDAIEDAWAIVNPQLREAVSNREVSARTDIDAVNAVGDARAQRGKKGQEALNKVWRAGDVLCSIAGTLGL